MIANDITTCPACRPRPPTIDGASSRRICPARGIRGAEQVGVLAGMARRVPVNAATRTASRQHLEQRIARSERPTAESERPTWTRERPISPSRPRSDGPVGPIGPVLGVERAASSGDIAQGLGDVVGDDDASDGTGRFNSSRPDQPRTSLGV